MCLAGVDGIWGPVLPLGMGRAPMRWEGLRGHRGRASPGDGTIQGTEGEVGCADHTMRQTEVPAGATATALLP